MKCLKDLDMLAYCWISLTFSVLFVLHASCFCERFWQLPIAVHAWGIQEFNRSFVYKI